MQPGNANLNCRGMTVSGEIGNRDSGPAGASSLAEADPIALLERDHERHRLVCDRLEEIADALPEIADPKLCADVARFLRNDLLLHHRDEEAGLFSILRTKADLDPTLRACLELLTNEHVSDESVAEELLEILDQMATGTRVRNPDMAGYVLRNFFESYRRHIEWENRMLFAAARGLLSAADRSLLLERMIDHRFGELGAKPPCNGRCDTCKNPDDAKEASSCRKD